MQEGKLPRLKTNLFGGRFRELRNLLGLTQEQMARRLGVTTATYNRYEKGHREPTVGLLYRMAKLAPGINAEWLLTGTGDPFDSEESHRESSFLRVPLLVGTFAGEALDIGQLSPNWLIAFNREWVRGELKCDPDSLFLMEMAGDSMAPTILPGDLVLVQRDSDIPSHDAIHVLRVGGAIQVRRLQWLSPEQVEILPDNSLYKGRIMSPGELSQGGSLVGRVVWSGKRH